MKIGFWRALRVDFPRISSKLSEVVVFFLLYDRRKEIPAFVLYLHRTGHGLSGLL